MSLEINDTGLAAGITIKKAYVNIDYHTVNPAAPAEDGTKRYNVNLFLNFWNPEKEEVYRKCVVSINGLSEDQLNFETYYKGLKEYETFAEAKDA